MSEGWQSFTAAIHFTITNVVKFHQRIRSGNFYLPIDLTSKTLNTHEQMQYRQLQQDKAFPPFLYKAKIIRAQIKFLGSPTDPS